jgi:hypothetical protein
MPLLRGGDPGHRDRMQRWISMRVELHVAQPDLEDEAEGAWRNFRARIPSCPFTYAGEPSVEVRPLELPPGATASATLRDAVGTLSAVTEFRLTKGFFTRQSERRACLLLHEALHIKVSLGRLHQNHLAIRQFERQHGCPTVTGLTQAEWIL